jgi:hypothetical protein
MGLPKFWESVGRDSGRPNLSVRLQGEVIKRVKHMVGYPEVSIEALEADGDGFILTELDQYGLGTVRTREAYLELTNIDLENKVCKKMTWCEHGSME